LAEPEARGDADRGVLVTEQFLRLRRPGHQLAVEQQPVAAESIEEPTAVGGIPDACEQLAFELIVVEEPAAGTRVARAEALVDDTEAATRNVLVTAHDDNRTRAHVLLLADDLRYARLPVIGEGLGRMLEQLRIRARLRG